VHTDGTTYIPALGVWANVLPQMVAPDGRSYVSQRFGGGRTTITLTDARGTRTLLSTTPFLDAFAFTSTGVLLMDSSPLPGVIGPPAQLRLEWLDASTGELRPIAPLQVPVNSGYSATYIRASDAIWLTVGGEPGAGATVSRYDLATGQTTEWLSSSDAHGVVQVAGADSHGAPIVQVASSDVWHTNPARRAGIAIQTLLVTSPHRAAVLNRGRVGNPGVASSFSPLSVTEGDSVWLGADDGAIWLYRPARGLQHVASITTSNHGPPGVAISGACI
jgi:formylmethanofuran dehydrogenase subunit D